MGAGILTANSHLPDIAGWKPTPRKNATVHEFRLRIGIAGLPIAAGAISSELSDIVVRLSEPMVLTAIDKVLATGFPAASDG